MTSVIRTPDGMRYVDDLQARIERVERLIAGDTETRLVDTEIGLVDADSRLDVLEGPGSYLDTQSINGATEGYSGQFTVAVNPLSTGVASLQISYTPPVDAWWEVTCHIGVVQKVDAAYHYMYGGFNLSQADVDGVTSAYSLITQNSSVQLYEARAVTRLLKLAAGQTYIARSYLGGMSGGTWAYYRGPGQLWMNGKAWRR